MQHYTTELGKAFIDDYDQSSFLSTGIPAMDSQLMGHGIRKQRLTVLLGRPGCGKTFFIVNWMVRLAEMGQKSYFFSGEMPLSDSLFRFLQVSNRMDWRELLRIIHSKNQVWIDDRVQRYLGNIEIDTTRPLTMEHIEQRVQEWSPFVQWFFIDHHMKIRTKYMKDLYSVVTDILNSLTMLSQVYDTRIVLVVMANRGAGDGSTAPALHEGRGSGNLEDNCDHAWSVALPGRDQKCDEKRQDSIELLNKKNRYGFIEHFSMYYNKFTGVLYDNRGDMLDSLPQEVDQNKFLS